MYTGVPRRITPNADSDGIGSLNSGSTTRNAATRTMKMGRPINTCAQTEVNKIGHRRLLL